jgi:3-oxoacyl-[acyl-carrier-protein] synthase II
MTRVVVTGIGAVTPVGNNAADTWEAVLAGRSGIGRITRFDASDLRTQIAAEVKGFSPSPYLSHKEARRMDPLAHYAASAAGQALEDAGLEDWADLDRSRVAVVVGAAVGGMTTMVSGQVELMAKGPGSISPFFIPAILANTPGALIAMKHRFTGPNFALSAACATGNHAIGEALTLLSAGSVDVVVCGGAEACIVALGIGGFDAMRALSTTNDDPPRACRPFDKTRNGFVMGEGAGFLVLESWQHAERRGASVYAEVAGYGATADAYHISAPEPDGTGAFSAMRIAMESASIVPEHIDYINAHGTGTQLNDAIETRAIRRALGAAAYRVPVSSTKAVTGHLLGAAGAVEALIVLLAMRHSQLPPTINLTTPDPACDLDYVPLASRPAEIRVAMSNAFGFGGHNATVLFRRVDGE